MTDNESDGMERTRRPVHLSEIFPSDWADPTTHMLVEGIPHV